MAVYKVIQDVEAEDKLIGFLTLKGFIYAAIAAVSAFIEVRTLISGSLGPIKYVVMLAFLGPMLLFGVLASPLGRDQPTEVWLLSRIRFFFKPRKRIWDQSGINNLVTITAPKRTEVQLTKNMTQREVRSRLQALASTLDSRGWAVRNMDIDSGGGAPYVNAGVSDDRLVAPSNLPQEEPVIDIHASDDIMDEKNNPTAQKFAAMMQQADDKRRKDVLDKVNSARSAGGNTTFLDNQNVAGSSTIFVGSDVVAPGGGDDEDSGPAPLSSVEQELLQRKHREEAEIESKLPKDFMAQSGLAAAKKGPAVAPTPTTPKTPPPRVTPEAQAAKLELAQSGNDLSVASIASLANRKNIVQQIGPNEFEIDLH